MRHPFLLLVLLGWLHAGSALPCDIVNKRPIHVGGSEGVVGECSNNSHAIQCIPENDGNANLTCIGPEGSFNGPDLKSLIATACGCGANPESEAPDQLEQELED